MDKNLENIINRVANKNSVAPAKLKLATEIFFKNAKQLIQRDDMPTIMIHGIGRFTPSEKKIKKKKLLIVRHLKMGRITQEQYDELTTKLDLVLEKIKRNEHRRNK